MSNATSSQASADGPTPCNLQDGASAQCGRAPVRVSRFRALESEKAMPINDTCGPLFTRSSPSANLQRCLENRLLELLDWNGPAGSVLILRELDVPSGPS